MPTASKFPNSILNLGECGNNPVVYIVLCREPLTEDVINENLDRYNRSTFLRESVIVEAHKAVVSWEWQTDSTYKVVRVN